MTAEDITIDFTNGRAVIDWNAKSTGIRLLSQKLVVNMMTNRGSDKFDLERGSLLEPRLYSSGVYDAQTTQHELNFAAVSAKQDVREGRDTGLVDPTSEVADFQVLLQGIEDGHVSTILYVVSVAGEKTGTPAII